MRQQTDVMMERLAQWVRIPSLSCDPDHAVDVTRSARWLSASLRDSGFPVVEEWRTAGLPAVYACWPADDPGAPTVLVYSHHDVNAVIDEEWHETEPFAGVLREGRLHGRGASDAKGQVLCHLWALRAHLAATGRRAPAVTVKFLIEGEEEIGSVHLDSLLARHRRELRADVVMVSDTMLWSTDKPAVCTGVRGAVSATLTVSAARHDIHNGAVAGAAGNPLTELSRLLGSLREENGRVAVPGFYDQVEDPSASERAQLAAIAPNEPQWLARTGAFGARGETGFSILERVWLRPAAEVTSLLGGRPELPGLGVIPATATAGLVFRLVPGQQADDIAQCVRQWVEQRVGSGFTFDLDLPSSRSDPYTTPTDHPAFTALEQAISRALGAPPVHMRNGGAAPAAQLARAVEAPVLFYGTGLLEDGWHSADERVEVQALVQGAETLAHWLSALPAAMA
ncbi:M20/M25/M40 family metallo-hydrolase [Streptomyces sp. NPDC006283]|uniref:M20/M25/M40 family metallo-hydrolase n=1 Tax=Streptomyces sp. NPDC006283 TaxID=3156741 RepID=UPI0033AF0DC4